MTTATPDIGIIGLGLLGSAISDCLIRHHFRIVGHDLNPAKAQALAPRGLNVRLTAAEVFQECETVLLCLPTSAVVSQTLNDAVRVLRPGHLIVDTTTGDPTATVEIARRLQQLDVDLIEARICGSSEHMRRGDAVLGASGNAQRIEQLQSVFQAISCRHFTLSAIGSASRFKLVHNLILGLNRAALAEGLQFGRALGLDAGEMLEILLQTPAASQAMAAKGRKMSSADYEPQATLAQHLKDVTLIMQEARQCGANTPLSQLHQKLLEHAVLLGFGDADNSAIIEAFHGLHEGNGQSRTQTFKSG